MKYLQYDIPFVLQKGELVKPNYNSVDLAEVELAATTQMVNIHLF